MPWLHEPEGMPDRAFFDVTAIARRKNAVLVSIISQVTPSKSSLIKRVAYQPAFLRHLRHHLNISGVARVFIRQPADQFAQTNSN